MARPVTGKLRKKRTTVAIDPVLRQKAAEYHLNLSQLLEMAIRRELKKIKKLEEDQVDA